MRHRKSGRWVALVALGFLFAVPAAFGEAIVRKELDAGAVAALRGGRMLYMELTPPRGDAGRGFLQKYLANPDDWKQYKDRMTVAVPFARLNAKTQRRTLEAIFPDDFVDQSGWWHTVTYDGAEGAESLALFAEWVTGNPSNSARIRTADHTITPDSALRKGQQVLIPKGLLLPVMQTLSPKAPPLTAAVVNPAVRPASPPAGNGLLSYGRDREGDYAEYRLKKGESLYTAVVVRFTDYYENADIHRACEIIQKRSGIRNVRKMGAGQRILIPLEMVSDAYLPRGTEQREEYEAMQAEVRRVSTEQVVSKNLEGVVVILDPGHGGRDQGAAIDRLGLYEDELNYDIVCRVKQILETRTRARVHVTVLDPNQDYRVSDARRFVHDTDEVVLVTPHYRIEDAKTSANLRWYLANDIYRRERDAGVSDRKIIFASIHCDALFNDSLRGAMVYVPGAAYRRDTERPAGSFYNQFKEVRSAPAASCTPAQRRLDEALSRNFANVFLQSLRSNNPPIKVHDAGDPVRNVIRQSGGRAYVPAVLRNCSVPTKVLIETANMTNPQDQERLSDPQWRQAFAEAFVNALVGQFD